MFRKVTVGLLYRQFNHGLWWAMRGFGARSRNAATKGATATAFACPAWMLFSGTH